MEGILYKIKEGKLETWKAWCHLLSTQYRERALETLKEEKCTYEAFGVFQIGEDFYTLGLGEGECLPANMENELNEIHRSIKKDCLVKVGPVEMLYELKVQ